MRLGFSYINLGMVVLVAVGAKRVLYEAMAVDMRHTGMFINCEDGLRIPW